MIASDARRTLLLAAGVAIAAAAVACGGGSDGKVDDDARSQPASAPVRAADRAQVEKALRGLQADYDAGDGAGYCARLTASGRAEVEDYGRRYDQGTTCRAVVLASSRFSRELGLRQEPAEVLSVRIAGDRAVAVARKEGQRPQPMRLRRVDGRWRIPSPGFDIGYDQPSDGEGNPVARVERAVERGGR